MRNQNSTFSNEIGFTLIETLVGLIIFTIVLLANGKVMNNILKLQAESNIQLVVIDVMQSRLQKAQVNSAGTSVCDNVDTTDLAINNVIYYLACSTEKIEKDAVIVEWPVLGASTDSSKAQLCAEGTTDTSCYVVGR